MWKVNTSDEIEAGTTTVIRDDYFTLQDDGDTTKQLRFQLSGITTATTRTLTVPDASDTIVTLAETQTLTNKTLTSPSISAPAITGAATLAGSTYSDNLVIDNQKELRLSEADGSGSNYLGFRAPSALTTDTTFTLPDGDGSSGQGLSTNGSGTLSWTTLSSPPTVSNKTASFTADTTDTFYTCDTSSADVTATLPAASGNSGLVLRFKKTLTTDTTFTLPDGDGSSGQGLSTNGSGTLSWTTLSSPPTVSNKTASFTADTTDTFYTCDTSSADVTATLPAASGNSGLVLRFKKTHNDNTLILDGNSSETIDGATTVELVGDDQECQIICDGTNWQIMTYTPATCYIKDEKSSGTASGTFTSGAWQTRTLNTVSGDTAMVSLSSNQFTLGVGTYQIIAKAPAFDISLHKAKLRNTSDSSDTIIGSSEFNNASIMEGDTSSFVYGEFTLTASKTFEIQHYCNSTQATNGFGTNVSFSVVEVYCQVKLVKVR